MFKIANMRTLKERPTEVYKVGASAVTLGQVLKLSSGLLVSAEATDTPEYLTYASGDAGAEIPVYRVIESDVFETTFAADASAVDVGSKVTLHTDAKQVTATTTNGIFTITKKLGSGAIGTKVQGMFRR